MYQDDRRTAAGSLKNISVVASCFCASYVASYTYRHFASDEYFMKGSLFQHGQINRGLQFLVLHPPSSPVCSTLLLGMAIVN